jgi:hypothetical protein
VFFDIPIDDSPLLPSITSFSLKWKDFKKENKEIFCLSKISNQIKYFELNFTTTKIWCVGVIDFVQLLCKQNMILMMEFVK